MCVTVGVLPMIEWSRQTVGGSGEYAFPRKKAKVDA